MRLPPTWIRRENPIRMGDESGWPHGSLCILFWAPRIRPVQVAPSVGTRGSKPQTNCPVPRKLHQKSMVTFSKIWYKHMTTNIWHIKNQSWYHGTYFSVSNHINSYILRFMCRGQHLVCDGCYGHPFRIGNPYNGFMINGLMGVQSDSLIATSMSAMWLWNSG